MLRVMRLPKKTKNYFAKGLVFLSDLSYNSSMSNTTPAKADAQILNLANSYAKSNDARTRNMMRGKAWKLIRKTYTVETNRQDVWQEWCKLADAGKGSWLVK